jgi:hypothetical protein
MEFLMERNMALSASIFGQRLSLKACYVLVAIGCVASGMTSSAQATTFSREQDIVDLKLGQRVKVDDGTCPAGQVKEISGAKMTATGVVRAQRCIPRVGIKSK